MGELDERHLARKRNRSVSIDTVRFRDASVSRSTLSRIVLVPVETDHALSMLGVPAYVDTKQ